jgi:hypothetical protein
MSENPPKIFLGSNTRGACPLCGFASHVGKCPKPEKGRWWCGLCLVTHTDTGPALPPSVLLAAGVRRTSRWCVRCGCPVCPEHRYLSTGYANAHPRCLGNCLTRKPVEIAAITARLEIYVPDFLTAGPVRCKVCQLPAFRSSLCQRHYTHVRDGRTELPIERMVVPRGYRTVQKTVALHPIVSLRVRELACAAGKTMSAWMAEAITVAAKAAQDPTVIGREPNPALTAAIKAVGVKRRRRPRRKREAKGAK